MEHAIGTLIKTETNNGLFHGMVTDYYYCSHEGYVTIFVTWNDCDQTEETFCEHGDDYDKHDYFFCQPDRDWETSHYWFRF